MDTKEQAAKIINRVLARLALADRAHWTDEIYLLCEDRRAITDGALRKVLELLERGE